jgi:NADH dehydrogenase [ubiquinone] 1 alpha subcomplex assembly factor 7
VRAFVELSRMCWRILLHPFLPVSTHGPLPQATFLDRMGLAVRVDALEGNAKTEERKIVIRQAAQRLVDLTGMGREYQVLGLSTCGEKSQKTNSEKPNVWPFMEADR